MKGRNRRANEIKNDNIMNTIGESLGNNIFLPKKGDLSCVGKDNYLIFKIDSNEISNNFIKNSSESINLSDRVN